MKRFKDFINETLQVYNGCFKVTLDMISNGKMIKNQIPYYVKGYFDCSALGLTTLEGTPSFVNESFFCNNNLLSSLEGCPTKVNGFYCHNNQLTSLEGCPSKIDGDFYCNYNQLTNLEGCPTTINDDFNCSNNRLTSLEGCPISVGGNLFCSKNLQDLTIEHDFIKSGRCSSKENYWIDLLKYMIDKKINLDNVKGWPEGFLSPKVIASAKGIVKFNL